MSFFNVFQAKSPVRTLDELHVTESVSVPNFPSVTESKPSDIGAQGVPNNSEKEFNGFCQEFGIRSGHRCLVVKARSHSFLYHQVGFSLLLENFSYILKDESRELVGAFSSFFLILWDKIVSGSMFS